MAKYGPIDRAGFKKRFESLTPLDVFWVRDLCNDMVNDPRRLNGREMLTIVARFKPEARKQFINALYEQYPDDFHQR